MPGTISTSRRHLRCAATHRLPGTPLRIPIRVRAGRTRSGHDRPAGRCALPGASNQRRFDSFHYTGTAGMGEQALQYGCSAPAASGVEVGQLNTVQDTARFFRDYARACMRRPPATARSYYPRSRRSSTTPTTTTPMPAVRHILAGPAASKTRPAPRPTKPISGVLHLVPSNAHAGGEEALLSLKQSAQHRRPGGGGGRPH